jgi:hypothetical protein
MTTQVKTSLTAAVASESDNEIEKLLQNAFLNSIRATGEYLLGRYEERMSAENEAFKESFDKILDIAEIFYSMSKKERITINQFRIGIDYSSSMPAVLMLISEKDASRINEIRALARQIERHCAKRGSVDCLLWTKVDRDICQETVETDFPYYRKLE